MRKIDYSGFIILNFSSRVENLWLKVVEEISMEFSIELNDRKNIKYKLEIELGKIKFLWFLITVEPPYNDPSID
jgi:hypothetical protein